MKQYYFHIICGLACLLSKKKFANFMSMNDQFNKMNPEHCILKDIYAKSSSSFYLVLFLTGKGADPVMHNALHLARTKVEQR